MDTYLYTWTCDRCDNEEKCTLIETNRNNQSLLLQRNRPTPICPYLFKRCDFISVSAKIL